MVKKINHHIYFSILVSILLIILSGLCIFDENLSFEIVTCSITGIFIVQGIYLVVMDFKHKSLFMNNFLYGSLSIIIGIVLLLYPETLKTLIPIVVGVWFMITSLLNLRFSRYLKTESTLYTALTVILDVVALGCGVILICKPVETSAILMTTLGLTIMVYSIINIIDMLIIKKYIKEISKNIKHYISEFIR